MECLLQGVERENRHIMCTIILSVVGKKRVEWEWDDTMKTGITCEQRPKISEEERHSGFRKERVSAE